MATKGPPRFNVGDKVVYSTNVRRPFVGEVFMTMDFRGLHHLKNYLADLTGYTMEELYQNMDESSPNWRDEAIHIVSVDYYLDSQEDGNVTHKVIPDPGLAHFCSDSELVEYMETNDHG